MKARSGGHPIPSLWHRLETDLSRYPVQKLWLTGTGGAPLGLLLLGEEDLAPDLHALLADLAGKPDGRPGLPGSLVLPEILGRQRLLSEELARLRALAQTDPLTGLANLRRFREQLQVELDRVRRTNLPCALLMIDIDHFKAINDHHGHENGNEALKEVAAVLREQTRKVDIPARYGGEEFAVLLPGASLRMGLEAAERLRAAVSARALVLDGKPVRLTVSLGLAVCSPFQALTPEALIRMADDELYRAKREGRNRVCHALPVREKKECQVSAEERAQLFDRKGLGA